MSVNRSILKKSRHIGIGVFIVHSSMANMNKTPRRRIIDHVVFKWNVQEPVEHCMDVGEGGGFTLSYAFLQAPGQYLKTT
jgi:hypothetical protein